MLSEVTSGIVSSICVKTSKHTKDIGAIQKGADFVKAYALGFDVNVSTLHGRMALTIQPTIHVIRMPSLFSVWMTSTSTHSRSRTSRLCMVIICPAPSVRSKVYIYVHFI